MNTGSGTGNGFENKSLNLTVTSQALEIHLPLARGPAVPLEMAGVRKQIIKFNSVVSP